MNSLEKQMVNLLLDLKENHNVSGVKAEFEAEGTRMGEAMRLQEVRLRAGLGLTLKIGGCEALKDMFDAISLGAERVIAPMVETAYALQKYINAINLIFTDCQKEDTEFLVNIETITAFHNFEEMLALPEIRKIHGVVIGRLDLCRSLGLTREDINSELVLNLAQKIAKRAKESGLEVAIGGEVSVHSLPFFKSFPEDYINRFETRKVIFDCPQALKNPEEALLKAIEFEILWLKNKQDYYGAIHREDDARLEILEKRYQKSIQELR